MNLLFLKIKFANIKGFECHSTSTNFILIKTKQDSSKLQKEIVKTTMY